METPNLDDMLDHLQESESGFSTKEQRAELIALKQRCEDLELMLRAALCGEITSITEREHRIWIKKVNPMLDDDGTGLPLLTNEAREALRKR